jgi:hypothetical protein
MPSTITAKFDTRREAEMAVEHLVQAHHIERTDIFITPEGSENSAGEEIAGSDTESDDRKSGRVRRCSRRREFRCNPRCLRGIRWKRFYHKMSAIEGAFHPRDVD